VQLLYTSLGSGAKLQPAKPGSVLQNLAALAVYDGLSKVDQETNTNYYVVKMIKSDKIYS
jgi:hypothetical protein